MSREAMFWIWLASTAAIVIVGALLVRKFNRDQDKGQGHDKPA